MKKLLSPWFWLRLVVRTILILVLCFLGIIGLVYWHQDKIVQTTLTQVNSTFVGEITIKGSHISPFANFPYISIDLEDFHIYEEKAHSHEPIVAVADAYFGFDIWTIISGQYEIKSVKLQKGDIKLIQHQDGSFNVANALSPLDSTKTEDAQKAFELHLNAITLDHVDIHKINESTNVELDLFVDDANAKFRTKGDHTMVALDARFTLNVIHAKDTTFIRHKHFDIHTQLDYDSKTQKLEITPSGVDFEMAQFMVEGAVELKDDMEVDVKVHGTKPNFDLLIAFAPEELIPTLKSYSNKGKIYFEAVIKGKTANGNMPSIRADFGCKEGLIANKRTNKKLENMAFSGYFTNGNKRDLSSMEFVLNKFKARPDAGVFDINLRVVNFLSPEIDLKLNSEFNLDFLAKFFNINNLKDVDGNITLKMSFHDIIDLEHPEKSIEKLNESYNTEFLIRNLKFRSENFHLPIQDINAKVKMEGHTAMIEYFTGKVGHSDLSISGSISDLPAILHHTNQKIETNLLVESKLLDLEELTYNDSLKTSSFPEQITDFSVNLGFITSARAITESPNLPVGEFLVRDFHATLKHYPHKLHDFHADIFIQDEDIRVVDFSGEIDGSDFHFSGKIKHYDILLQPTLRGDTEIDFDLVSKHIRLEDLFTYKGENYVPKDYQHEDFQKLHLHGRSELHFSDAGLHSADTYLDQLSCTMQIHKCRFEKFNGRIHYEDDHLVVEALKGQIGQSDFNIYLNYYLGKDPTIRKRDNFFSLHAQKLNIDELLEYNPPPSDVSLQPEDHEAGFNIFNIPFTDIKTEFDIKQLNYHRYFIQNFKSKLRMQQNHYLYFDECSFNAAGGNFDIKGYFNGSNPKNIYFNPDIYIEKADLDKLMVKFENFGQDHLVSENLHGKISCGIAGKIHVHADMVPIINESNLLIDVEIVNGRLENYKPLEAFSEYFQDKNLSKLKFDTLRNAFELRDNKVFIPNMTINSSVGFIELSGEQTMDNEMSMDFYFKIPFKMITKVIFQKLFKKKQEEVDLDKEDAIEYKDPNKKIVYVHVNLSGNATDYKIVLKKDNRAKKEKRLLNKKRKMKVLK